MANEYIDFDWEAGNLDKNLKHGVQDWEIEEALRDSRQVRESQSGMNHEERYVLFARAPTSGRYLRIVYTKRVRDGRELIRPISAIPLAPRQKKRYRRRK